MRCDGRAWSYSRVFTKYFVGDTLQFYAPHQRGGVGVVWYQREMTEGRGGGGAGGREGGRGRGRDRDRDRDREGGRRGTGNSTPK